MASTSNRPASTILLAATVLACSWTAGCGKTDSSATSANALGHKRDRDYDFDHNDDDGEILNYGHAADAADRQAVSNMIRSYYQAAATENGAAACALLLPALAESIAEQFGDSSKHPPTCANTLNKILRLEHQKLAGEATVRVLLVRIDGRRSLSMLRFANNPAIRQIYARRSSGRWKLRELFDTLVE